MNWCCPHEGNIMPGIREVRCSSNMKWQRRFVGGTKMVSKAKSFTRRDFLSTSGKTVAGLSAASVLASCQKAQVAPVKQSRVIGANDRINLAVVGINSRGNGLLNDFANIPNSVSFFILYLNTSPVEI